MSVDKYIFDKIMSYTDIDTMLLMARMSNNKSVEYAIKLATVDVITNDYFIAIDYKTVYDNIIRITTEYFFELYCSDFIFFVLIDCLYNSEYHPRRSRYFFQFGTHIGFIFVTRHKFIFRFAV